MMIFRALACGLFRGGHDFVGMTCKRCGTAWEWVSERSQADIDAEILRDLERMAGSAAWRR